MRILLFLIYRLERDWEGNRQAWNSELSKLSSTVLHEALPFCADTSCSEYLTRRALFNIIERYPCPGEYNGKT